MKVLKLIFHNFKHLARKEDAREEAEEDIGFITHALEAASIVAT